MTGVWSFSSRYGRRRVRLWGPVIAILFASLAVSLGVWGWMNRRATLAERAARVAESGQLVPAERLAWQVVQKQPEDLEAWIRFLDLHAALRRQAEESGDDGGASEDAVFADDPIRSAVKEPDIRRLLDGVKSPEVATLAKYWYELQASLTAARSENAPPPVTETVATTPPATDTLTTAAPPVTSSAAQAAPTPDATAITSLANRPAPARLANYLLGRAALKKEEWVTAARRFEREGLAFPKSRRRNLRRALAILIGHDEWDEVRKRARDPRYKDVWDASLRLELARHDHDWPGILIWGWPAGFVEVEAWPIALALLSAVLWLLIATRLGRAGDDVPGRRMMYALAFILGIASVYPTIVLIAIEDDVLNLKETGNLVQDTIYYIFGVGLREELSKLLMFLPLVPALKRRGSRIEAMTCGALVGLGFAVEENVQYFHQASASVAMSRFLTANFMHMALTSLVALSVYDAARGRSTSRDAFNVIFPLVVAMHGVYDLLLSNEALGMLSIFSMVLLMILAQQFLRQLLIASNTMEQEGVLRLLVASLALLIGVSYLYATTLAGPLIALRIIGLGVLGVGFLIYVFVRELA
jgi:RsiW-degrading membrane proteinase PrsW (M82 family)